MKVIILILLVVLPFIQAQEATACANHPFLQKIESFVGTLETELESSEFSSINEQLSIYKQQDGISIWNSEIDADENQCPDFDGQQSCCTDGFINIIELVLKANIKKGKKEDKPVPKQFLTEFTKNLGKCAGKEAVEEFLAIEEISDFLADLQECQLQQYTTHTNFMRRNTCSLCFSAQEIEDNFDENGKLIVEEVSLNEYIESVEEDFQCFIDINDSLYNSVIDQYTLLIQDYQDLDTEECDKFMEWVDLIIDNDGEDIKPKKPKNCKQKSSAFGKGCSEEITGDENQFKPGNALGPRDVNGNGGMQQNRPKPSDGGFSQNGGKGGPKQDGEQEHPKGKPGQDGEQKPPKGGPQQDGEHKPPKGGPQQDGEQKPPKQGGQQGQQQPPKQGGQQGQQQGQQQSPQQGGQQGQQQNQQQPPQQGGQQGQQKPPQGGQQQQGQQQPTQGGSRILQEEDSGDYSSAVNGYSIYQEQDYLNKDELFEVFKEEITDPALELDVNVDSIQKIEDEPIQNNLVTESSSSIIQSTLLVILSLLALYL